MPKETRNLPVKLSEQELKAKSDDLAKANLDRTALEERKSAAASSFNKQVKEIKGAITQLAQAISSRSEYRDVEIEERRNETTFMIETWRLDTEEKIAERAMTTSERQIPLFPVQGGKQEDQERPPRRTRRSGDGGTDAA